MGKLHSCEILSKGRVGTVCVGKPGEIINGFILPLAMYENVGIGQNPIVLHNGQPVGIVTVVFFDDDILKGNINFKNVFPPGLYHCAFTFSSIFGEKIGVNTLLEEVIIDGITINEQINKNNCD